MRRRGAAPWGRPGGVSSSPPTGGSERAKLRHAITLLRHAATLLEEAIDAAAPPLTDRLIDTREVFRMVAFSRATLGAKISAGELPAPGPRASPKATRLWRWSDVDAYIKRTKG